MRSVQKLKYNFRLRPKTSFAIESAWAVPGRFMVLDQRMVDHAAKAAGETAGEGESHDRWRLAVLPILDPLPNTGVLHLHGSMAKSSQPNKTEALSIVLLVKIIRPNFPHLAG
jgi:hypothetical protein